MKTDKSISGYMISGPPLNCAHFWEHAAPCMEREEEIELSLQWGGQSQVTSKGNSSQQCLGNRITSCCEPNWRKKKNLKVRKKKIPPKKPTNSKAKKKKEQESQNSFFRSTVSFVLSAGMEALSEMLSDVTSFLNSPDTSVMIKMLWHKRRPKRNPLFVALRKLCPPRPVWSGTADKHAPRCLAAPFWHQLSQEHFRTKWVSVLHFNVPEVRSHFCLKPWVGSSVCNALTAQRGLSGDPFAPYKQ